jgi:hypothetical protein
MNSEKIGQVEGTEGLEKMPIYSKALSLLCHDGKQKRKKGPKHGDANNSKVSKVALPEAAASDDDVKAGDEKTAAGAKAASNTETACTITVPASSDGNKATTRAEN